MAAAIDAHLYGPVLNSGLLAAGNLVEGDGEMVDA